MENMSHFSINTNTPNKITKKDTNSIYIIIIN